MARTSQAELYRVLDTLEAQGWRIQRNKHIKCIPPDKSKPIVVIPLTNSGGRGYKNMLSQLKKSGAII